MNKKSAKAEVVKVERKKQKNIKDKYVDIFWKARNFKIYPKTADWYWLYFLVFGLTIFFSSYYYENYFLSVVLFLVMILNLLNHKYGVTVVEYRINDDAIYDGKDRIDFKDIKSFNVDYNEMYILIKKEGKSFIVKIPYEENHNIEVIEKILESKITRNKNLKVPLLEQMIERFMGY